MYAQHSDNIKCPKAPQEIFKMPKIFLTDLDGVWVDWISHFTEWVRQTKSIEPVRRRRVSYSLSDGEYYSQSRDIVFRWILEFNASSYSDLMPAYEGSHETLSEIKSMGYNVIAITQNNKRRPVAIMKLFPDIFEEIIVVGETCSKRQCLSWFKPTFWLEDLYENAVIGSNLGHNSMMLSRGYNERFSQIDGVNGRGEWNYDTISRINGYEEVLEHIREFS